MQFGSAHVFVNALFDEVSSPAHVAQHVSSTKAQEYIRNDGSTNMLTEAVANQPKAQRLAECYRMLCMHPHHLLSIMIETPILTPPPPKKLELLACYLFHSI